MRVLIFSNKRKPETEAAVAPLRSLIGKFAEIVEVNLDHISSGQAARADLALVFGGDGTMLRAAHHMGYNQVPTLGINIGRLGFLADVPGETAATVIEQVLSKGFSVSEHLMLECTVQDGGERTLLGLNDIVIHSDPPLHMIEIELAIDGEPVATFRGDGLILSTPIGSTAHNLAAGGPILRQELPAFVITPICAHALTYRPLVDDAERTFSIALHRASHPARLIVDGQEHLPIAAGQRITVKRAAVKFKRIRVPGHSYYATLQEKLQWAAPPNYRTGHSHHP